MSKEKIPTNPPNNTDNEYVKAALKVIENNFSDRNKHKQDIKRIQDLVKASYLVAEPVGLDRIASGLLVQVVDNVSRKLQIPSATYYLQADKAEASSHIGRLLQDGVESVMEMGGLEACLTEKPAGFEQALYYGDCLIRIGTDFSSKAPIKFDLVNLDQVYVDSNATVMVSRTGTRQVTRIVVIYTYDYDQAKSLYPKAKFGVGRIPQSDADVKELGKTHEQETENDRERVEIAHYFDIGGSKPVHIVFAGGYCSILEKHIGSDYPFVDKKDEKAYIPIDNFKCQDSIEGFWNVGLGHLFYRYAFVKKQLLNKAIAQSMNSMNDTQVISVGGKKHGAILQRIREAREMAQNGHMGIVINDTGEPIVVSKLQADQYEQSIKVLNEWLDQEVKRFGFNLDAIRENKQTTATQILSETEVEDDKASSIICRNTEFFKRLHYRTMDFIREYVDPEDKTPIWTTLKIDKTVQEGETVMNPETGEPMMVGEKVMGANGKPKQESVVTTLGEIKQMLDKYSEGIYVEINTKTGIKERDSTTTAKMIMAMRGTQNPSIISQAYKGLVEANNIQIDTDSLDMPAQEGQGVPSGGIKDMAEEIMKPMP